MTDKSINASQRLVKPIIGGNSYGLRYFSDEHIDRLVRDLNSKLNNAPASGVNPQGSLERTHD